MPNRNHPGPRLVVRPVRKPKQKSLAGDSSPSGISFPDLPSMPGPLLKLQLALNAPTADVAAISEAIRSDIGLAARFLPVAVRDVRALPEQLPRFEELVIHLGLGRIRLLAAQAVILTRHPNGPTDLRACERAWKRARLTALAAEYLAARTGAVDSDRAYVAGLFHHLGYCLRSLHRDGRHAQATDPHELGYLFACDWNFPEVILESMRQGKHEDPASNSQLVREVVKTAVEWVLDVELQGIADAEYSQSLQCSDGFTTDARKN